MVRFFILHFLNAFFVSNLFWFYVHTWGRKEFFQQKALKKPNGGPVNEISNFRDKSHSTENGPKNSLKFE